MPALDALEPSPEDSLDDLIDEAREFERAGRLADAAGIWDRAAMLAGANGDITLVERIRLASAKCWVSLGEADAAETDLAVALASPDPGIAGGAANCNARLQLQRGNLAAAERSFRDAAIRFDQLGWTLDLATVLMDLGECLGRMDRLDDSEATLREARDLFRSIGHGLEAADCDDRIAAALIELGRYADALDRLAAAARVADASGDDRRIAYAHYRMGWTLAIADQPNAGLRWLDQGKTKYRELGDLVGGANCDEKAAMALTDLRDFDRAIDLYEEAIAVFEAFGHHHSARIAESNVADIFSGLSRYEEAAAQRRTDLLEQLPPDDGYVASGVTVRLASDLLALGQGAEALIKLDSVADYFTGRHSVVETARFHAVHARALLAVDRLSSAREEAGRMLSEFDRGTVPEQCAAALEVLAECERRTGTVEQADRLLAQAVALYLAVDEHDKATDLSWMLLPDRVQKSRDVGVTSTYSAGYI